MFPIILLAANLSQVVSAAVHEVETQTLLQSVRRDIQGADRLLEESRAVGQKTRELLQRIEDERREAEEFNEMVRRLLEKKDRKGPTK